MDDALAVLDAFGIERAWVVGHSWGGHLALHLLTAHPERLLGVVCVDPLPASPNVFVELDANVRSRLSPDEIDTSSTSSNAAARAGEITEDELIERFALVWPHYFVVPCALPPPAHIGVEASIGTNRSLGEHFERRTLVDRPPLGPPPRAVRARRAEHRAADTRPRRPARWCPAGSSWPSRSAATSRGSSGPARCAARVETFLAR